MIHNKKEFNGGIALLVVFFIILFAMFQPLFDGHNAMAYLDNLYNSISKGSAYYVPNLKEEAKTVAGFEVDVTFDMKNEAQAANSVVLLTAAGATASAAGKSLTVKGDYAAILDACLDDADTMYNNDGAALKAKYPVYAEKDDRQALYNWNTILTGFDALHRLVRKAVHQVQVGTMDAVLGQPVDKPLRDLEGLDSVDRLLNLGVEILDPDTDPVDAGPGKIADVVLGHVAGVHFDRDLGVFGDQEPFADSLADPPPVCTRQDRRAASAPMQVRRPRCAGNALGNEVNFLQKNLNIGSYRIVISDNFRVAPTEPAQRVAERDVKVEGQVETGIQPLQPAPVEIRADRLREVGGRRIAGVAGHPQVVAGCKIRSHSQAPFIDSRLPS